MSQTAKVFVGIVIAAVVILGGYALSRRSQPAPSRPSATTPAPLTGPVTLGVILPLTGDAVAYGESERKAIEVAVGEINATGGINGQPVELVIEDGKCDPQASGTAASKLVTIDEVKIIIGGACSGETLAAAEVTEPAKVILMSPSASSPKVSEAGDFVFRTYPSDALAGRIASKYAYDNLGARKVALFTELTDYAQALREVYRQAFTELGGEVVADETYNTGDTDFRTQVLKIKSAGADAVYVVPQTPTPGLAIFKQLRENGVTATFTTAEVLLDRKTVQENTLVLEGIVGVEVAVDFEGNPKAKAFANAHRAKFGAEPGTFGANAYDAVYLVKEAVAICGLVTECIRDWLYAVKSWPGVIGQITMDRNGDPIMGESVRKIVSGQVTDLGAYAP